MNSNRLLHTQALYLAFLLTLQTSDATSAPPDNLRVMTDFDRKEILVSGSNLGEGPNILLYDTFDTSSSVAGEQLPKKASLIGEWTEFNQYYLPMFSDYGRSGSHSFEAFDGETQETRILHLRFDGTQEVFVSYWVYLQGPDYFPGDFTSAPRTFSDDSSFKMLWLFDSDVRGYSSDVSLPTHVGGGRFHLSGNDGNLVTKIGNNWWSWDHWMRLSFWVKADPENPTAPGIIHFDTLSKDKGYQERIYNVSIFDEDGPATKQFREITVPGWVRSIQNSSTNLLYDDIYVSTGPNAAARVELGNAASLGEVTQLELLKIESWSETSIRATAPTVNKEDFKNLYLYITTKDGVTNEKGIPLITPPAQIENIEVD